jgi:hypothetical protein
MVLLVRKFRTLVLFTTCFLLVNCLAYFLICGEGWDWVHLVPWPQLDLLYWSRLIGEQGAISGMRIGTGNQSTQRKPATLSTTNPPWADLGSNPDYQGGKPVTNHLSYSIASTYLVYSLTLKTDAVWFSETSANFSCITRHHIPEYNTLHSHRCENLRSNWLYLYGLFHDALISSDHIVSNGTMINRWWIGKDVEGSGSDEVWGINPEFTHRTEENYEERSASLHCGTWPLVSTQSTTQCPVILR